MASILISGPAGANKSALARRLLREANEATVAADFQSIYAALALVERDPSGRYPLRDERLLPLVEYVRQSILRGALAQELDIIVTSSDGDPKRRAFLLSKLGPGAVERIIDPGEAVVSARLSDPESGLLSDECGQAIQRWYSRVAR